MATRESSGKGYSGIEDGILAGKVVAEDARNKRNRSRSLVYVSSGRCSRVAAAKGRIVSGEKSIFCGRPSTAAARETSDQFHLNELRRGCGLPPLMELYKLLASSLCLEG